jgi:protein TonB
MQLFGDASKWFNMAGNRSAATQIEITLLNTSADSTQNKAEVLPVKVDGQAKVLASKPVEQKQIAKSEAAAVKTVNTGAAKTGDGEGTASQPGDRFFSLVSSSVVPVYPKTALNQQWKGLVKVEVLVDKEGKPKKVTVIKSSGYAVLDQAYIRAIEQQYVFKPKVVNGQPMEDKIVLEYNFDLEN